MTGLFSDAVWALLAELNYIATRGELLIGMVVCIMVSLLVWVDLR